ncbi:MAG: DUF4382 domain-containing protein [Pseudomonadota bacterium]|nr:DUF4382 domain-containing protein [Pseudomonadota bacterium]MEE3118402.1 DUF4382 domain-containing protein [Pseudomonadota bacterium]
MHRSLKFLGVSALAAGIAACGGGGSSDSQSTGQVSVGVTDAPATEFTNVTIAFTGISLKPADGEWVTFSFDQPKSWNLLNLQGGLSEPLITDEEVPAGRYSELRLLVNTEASYLVLKSTPDEEKRLAVPSGEQSGLKLKGDFLVAADSSTDLTVDFDVRKSIVDPQGVSQADYLLKPSLRLLDNLEVGKIAGTVDYPTIQSSRMNNDSRANCALDYAGSVYVFQGADVAPSDLNVNNESGNPLMIVPVTDEDNNGVYEFTAAFLTAGEYTVSYSCQLDDNETDDDIEFDGTQNVTVTAGETAQAETIPLTL